MNHVRVKNRDKAPDRQIIPVMKLDCIRVLSFFMKEKARRILQFLYLQAAIVHCKAEDPFLANFCEVRFCTTL
jgi:hypothetical protein